jgi:hypothetical protein
MKKTKNPITGAIRVVAAASLLPLAMQATALEFHPTDEVKIDVDTTLTYGRQWRVDGRDTGVIYAEDKRNLPGVNSFEAISDRVQVANSDDASRNFDKGDVVSSRFSAVSDFDISYKNVGLFVRPQIFYDEVPYGKANYSTKYLNNLSLDGTSVNYNDPTNQGVGYNNSTTGGATNSAEHWNEDYKDTQGYTARFLDVYAYGNFAIGDKNLDVRVGRQVISWGEALMLQGGIAFAQNRVDASAATAPGAELKEIFLPTGAVLAQMNVAETTTVEAYWQYEWIPSTLFPAGSFFSAQDFIDGGPFITTTGDTGGTTTFMKRKEFEPSNNDQWGLALRQLFGEGTEVALYIVNYTDKYPTFWAANTGGNSDYSSFDTDIQGGSYSISYMEDIRLYGLTLNTVVGGLQTGIEYAYRANAPVVTGCTPEKIIDNSCEDPSWAPSGDNFYNDQLTGVTPWTMDTARDAAAGAAFGWSKRAEIHTLNMGGTYIFQPTALWDTAILVGELGSWYVGGYENDDLKFARLGGFTQWGQGMSMQFMPEYKNVMEGVDLTIPFFVNYGIDGSLSTFNYNEHSLWWSVGAEAVYLEHWRFAAYYNDYSGENNLLTDRDNVSVNVKYIF